jgi:N-acetylneuraminic acid mutarotase
MKVMNFMKSSKCILFSMLVLLLASCTSSTSYTLGRWRQRSDFDGARRTGAASFCIGDMGYIVGGWNGKAKRLKSMYSYNMANDFYTQLLSEDDTVAMPTNRVYATGFAVGGKGYVCCGYDGSNNLNDTWEYTPSTNTWRKVDDLPGQIRYGALSFTLGNYAYVGCGSNDDGELKDFYRYDPSAADGSHWTKVEGYGGTKRLFGTSFIIDNIVYIVGGENNGSDCKDLWKFDGSTWTRLRYITSDDDLVTESDDSYNDDYTSIVRKAGVAFSLNGKGYVALGSTASGTMRLNYWIYNPKTDLWSNNDGDVTDFEGSSRNNAVCLTNGTRVFVTTGGSGSSTWYDDTYEFLPNEYKEK